LALNNYNGGRAGESTFDRTCRSFLRALPFRVDRLKTEHCALDARTLDFSVNAGQRGDDLFSIFFLGKTTIIPRQIYCYITILTAYSRNYSCGLDAFTYVIPGNLKVLVHVIALFEDKIHRFADKDSHQIFVERWKGLDSIEIIRRRYFNELTF